MKLPRIPLRRQKLPKVVGKNVASGTQGSPREVSLEEGREDVARGEAVGEGVLGMGADIRGYAEGMGIHESLPGRPPDL